MTHTLLLLEASPYASGRFMCNLCWEKGCGPVYHCSGCDFDLHVTCAANAKQQTHFSHYHHPLHLCHCSTNHTCDGCGESIQKWAFRCETCDYDMHSLCVRAPRYILHPTHSHPLSLIKASDRSGVCDACDQVTLDLFYQCRNCDYNLHQFCATLPSQIKHPRHAQHLLRLQCKPPKDEATFMCAECGEKGKTWRFHCTSCRFYVHPRCIRLLHELPRPNLEVSLQEERSSAPTSSSSSLVLQNSLCVPAVSSRDLEAAEKVLRFAQEMLKVSASAATNNSSEECTNDEQDTCPTCLEGYDNANPKRSTTCGHHFHLPCILRWIERCTRCPICRKNVNIRM
ncbi:hypothetical protein L7F22_050038 [Adiantum nelumboides]|nr:hypothetical protein [Adiantum nelumboides]